MKRVLYYFLSFIIFFSSFSIWTLSVKAEGEHQFNIQAYDWNVFDNDWEGSGTGDELIENSNVEPGRVIMVSVYYVPGDTPEVSMQVGLQYDNTLVEPVYYDGELYVETDMSTTFQGGMWPAKGTSPKDKKVTNWQILTNHYINDSQINFIAQDSTNSKPLENEGVLATVYFKIKDNAQAGSVINFSYNDEYTTINQSRPKVTTSLNLNVFGEMSTSTTLSTLSVSNGNTVYELSPAFVPNSNAIKEFNVIVPNHMTSINVEATATDSYAIVASGTGSNSLIVGNNDINLIVQAQNGTQEIYRLHVYRLSNDASLSSLSFTNDVNIGTFNSNTTTYTALVPYSTSSTTITATTTHKNATIESSIGSWDLPNYGSTTNTKDIVVNAENCDSKYLDVPDNNCSSTTYKIDVTRTSPSTNSNLSDLSINGATITNFDPRILIYNLPSVGNEVTSLNIKAVVEDIGKATIISTLGTKSLNVGNNKLSVIVEAEDKSTKEYIINVRRLSNDSKLSNLSVSSNPQGNFTPTFTSTFYNYYTYTADSMVDKVNISASVNDIENATIISGIGEYNIDDTKSVDITVQAEDGTASVYVVKLVRNKSTNNNLKSLSLDGYELNETFSPNTTLYTANVSGDVTSVNVSAEVQDASKAVIIGGTGNHDLNIGVNTIQVRVEAENGTIKDYTISVTRAKKKVASLTDLKVDGVTIEGFSETTLEYTMPSVPFEKTSVNISATSKDLDSSISGDGIIELKTGLNKIYVTVTAQDGVTQTPYIINIERAKDDNAYLSDINIDDVTINNFNKEIDEYNITVKNEILSLNINAIPESANSNVSIYGNNNFSTTKDNIVTITVTSESGNIKIYKIHVTREKSGNNYLKSITLSSGLLNPTFDKMKNDYIVDVDRSITTMNIIATPEDNSSTYEITGPNSLEIGENIFKIIVTSEDNISNIYTIIVNRNPSDNNFLSNLTIDGDTILNFNKNTALYTIDVESTKSSITINASSEEVHAKISGLGTFDLDTGVNTFPIVVTAENGIERTYSIVINKSQSNDSSLSLLSVVQSNITPTFNPSVLNYKTTVAYSVTNVDIIATPNDPKSTVTGYGNRELKTGDNEFDIVVTSENNITTTYKLIVTRSKNNNANLSNIVISGGFTLTPNFDTNKEEYSLLVPNSTENLNITAYKQDPNAVSVEGDGLVNLKTGMNDVKIIVTAENGTTKKTYTLHIEREKSSDATLNNIVVDSGSLNPTFDKDVLKYDIIVPYEIENLNINATPTSSSSTINVTGNTNIKVGKNTASITVTAEDGSILVYTIEILRQPSTNNFLSSLSVIDSENKEYIETFLKTKLDYNITVENNIDKITIEGEREDSSSTIKGLGEKDLDIGENSFEISVTSNSGIERVYAINVIRKANSNNNLLSLEVVGYDINPKFNKLNISYTLNVSSDVKNITINATPEVPTSTVLGTGVFELNTGVNNFNIDVTSENGDSKTYVIVVNKEASNNNYLTNLSISPGLLEPNFNKETLSYNVNVDNSTTIMDISAEKEHNSAIVTGTGVKAINVGKQQFDIVVKAENNEIRIYTITVTRDASSNKDLSTLMINGKMIDNFSKDETKYSLNVENSVDKIIVDAYAADETATINGIGEIPLKSGSNTINVTVTAEDGTVKIYEIMVTRAKSSNNYLKELNVIEGSLSPEFDKETLNYNITVPYEIEKLTINPTLEVETSKIEIDGNNNFIVGPDNKVYINVLAEDETIRTYTINVTRQPQVNNFLNNMVITDNNGVRYSLSPEFNKNILNYEVELSGDITEVNINVTKEQTSLTVTGDGKIPITKFPQTHKVIVSTTGGLQRIYTIKFIRGLSSNKYLSSLTVDKGVLTPEFNKDETAYNVDFNENINEITITAIKGEENQTIIGDGLKKLVKGRNQFKVIVTAENGETNIYNIFVNVNVASDNVLTSLTVDKGVLIPEFNKNTKLYTVDLDSSEDEITINAEGQNRITGNGTYKLVDGANVFEIVSTTDDGDNNTYRVVVNKKNIISSYLSYLEIDGYNLNEKFNKDIYSYNLSLDNMVQSLNVIAIPEDKNATINITGNSDLKKGNNTISIVVTDENNNTKTYTINVLINTQTILNKIVSDIHTIENDYIKTVIEGKTAINLKSEMTNPNDQLKIYNIEGNEIKDSDTVATGYIVKLIIDNKEYDTKTIIIKGDVNNDGEVNVADIIKLRLHVLETTKLETYNLYAADVNDDGYAEISDLILIRRHILGNYNLFKREVE